jgi:hypothetical protein
MNLPDGDTNFPASFDVTARRRGRGAVFSMAWP